MWRKLGFLLCHRPPNQVVYNHVPSATEPSRLQPRSHLPRVTCHRTKSFTTTCHLPPNQVVYNHVAEQLMKWYLLWTAATLLRLLCRTKTKSCLQRYIFHVHEGLTLYHSGPLTPAACPANFAMLTDHTLPRPSVVFGSVSDSGQNKKTQVSGSWEKKPGKTRFSGFEMNAILSDKNSRSLWNYYCWSLSNLLANY